MEARNSTNRPTTTVRDSSGYAIFFDGDAGQAHMFAHRALDEGRMEEGRLALSAFLEGREAVDSKTVHLHWHLLVFEIDAGDVGAARDRFERHILPWATFTDQALTDAPAGLWRLQLAAPELALPWDPVARTAEKALGDSLSSYTELHQWLALAGAGATDALDRRLAARRSTGTPEDETLLACAHGLRAFAAREFALAAALLGPAVSKIDTLGGSRAQNELFDAIAREAARRARQTTSFAA